MKRTTGSMLSHELDKELTSDRGSGSGLSFVSLGLDFVYTYIDTALGLMGIPLFERFAEMVERLPARAVISAVILERKMLEEDLAHDRTVPINDVRSIIAFSEFLENAPDKTRLSKAIVPIQHLSLYRATVKRLVEAGELPCECAGLFDAAFSVSGYQSLKKN